MTHTEPLTLSHPDCHSESHIHIMQGLSSRSREGGREQPRMAKFHRRQKGREKKTTFKTHLRTVSLQPRLNMFIWIPQLCVLSPCFSSYNRDESTSQTDSCPSNAQKRQPHWFFSSSYWILPKQITTCFFCSCVSRPQSADHGQHQSRPWAAAMRHHVNLWGTDLWLHRGQIVQVEKMPALQYVLWFYTKQESAKYTDTYLINPTCQN